MTAAIEPDTTVANSSAAAAPAASPTSTICTISSCPASSAVRDGSRSVPTDREWRIASGEWRIAPPAICACYSLLAIRYSPSLLADHVRQQPEKAGVLDGARELALLLGGHRGDPARHDLAALGDVTLQQPHILVIDLGRI